MTLTSHGRPVFLGPIRRVVLDQRRVRWAIEVGAVAQAPDGRFYEQRGDVAVTVAFQKFSWFARRVSRGLAITLDPAPADAWQQHAWFLLEHTIDEPQRRNLTSGFGEPVAIDWCSSDVDGPRLLLVRPYVGYGSDRQREFEITLPSSARWSFRRARRSILKQTGRLIWLEERTDHEWQGILANAMGERRAA